MFDTNTTVLQPGETKELRLPTLLAKRKADHF